jgi:MarR family transcriptional regulator, lower aerobic nicotinate degradation pathway regulator
MAKSAQKTGANSGAVALYGLPGHLIRRCHQISVALFHQECAAFGLTPQQYAIVRVLMDNDGIDQISLAGLAALNRTTTGELVARMEAAGYLKREDGSEDRRVKNLFITKAGLTLVKEVNAGVENVQERLLEPLDKAERKQFIAYLARIAHINNELSRAPLRAPRKRKKP